MLEGCVRLLCSCRLRSFFFFFFFNDTATTEIYTLSLHDALPISLGLCAYTYLGYPALLKLLSLVRRAPPRRPRSFAGGWPAIRITLPRSNEAPAIAGTRERILGLPYPGPPPGLVMSGRSTHGTDAIVP